MPASKSAKYFAVSENGKPVRLVKALNVREAELFATSHIHVERAENEDIAQLMSDGVKIEDATPKAQE